MGIVAVGDTVGTILLAAFIARIFNFKFVPTLLVLFFVGELLHCYEVGRQSDGRAGSGRLRSSFQ